MPLLHMLIKRSDAKIHGQDTTQTLEISDVIPRQQITLKSYMVTIRNVTVADGTGSDPAGTRVIGGLASQPTHTCLYVELSCFHSKDITTTKTVQIPKDEFKNGAIPLLIRPASWSAREADYNMGSTLEQCNWSFYLSKPIQQTIQARVLKKDETGAFVPFESYFDGGGYQQATARVHLVWEYSINNLLS